eukprot:TRINITY_DN6121_c0_g1_i4.p1 TRINITY_DN6121_c0_g1~~TRINITY_DN6121_c0_g1_i4.p1  ORF type:complete len:484 (+),score=66.73 TRINITY_DN6121_c0_g1_i4:43-1494(+)
MWQHIASLLQQREEREQNAEQKQHDKDVREKKLKKRRIKRELKDLREIKFRKHMTSMTARVTKVNIEGLEKTKDYLVTEKLKPLFNVESFQDIIETTKSVQRELKELGCFKTVNIDVDTLEGEGEDQSYEVNIRVTESSLPYMNLGLANCKEDKEVGIVIRSGLCNITGRGDKVEFEYTRGVNSTKESSLSLVHPIKGLQTGSKFYLSISNSHYNLPFNIPLSQSSRSLSLGSEVRNGSVTLSCKLGLDLVTSVVNWSRLTTVQGIHRWNPVAETAGSQLIPSLKTGFTLDMLDSQLLPTHGFKFYLSHLLAMVPWTSEINYQQIKSGLSAYYPIGKYLSAGFATLVSHTFTSSHSQNQIPVQMISDSRTPLISRGGSFINSCYTGDLTAILYKFSLTSKLPLLQPNSMLCKFARFHTYLTGQYFREQSADFNRHFGGFGHYFGVGIVGTISDLGRFELNYNIPLKHGLNKSGLSFGFGTEFL